MQPHVTVNYRVSGVDVPYTECIDHGITLVAYVYASRVLGDMPKCATAAVAVLGDITLVQAAKRDPAARFAALERIVVGRESALMAVAELRAESDIPGDRPQYFMRLRDKSSMVGAIVARNVALPEFRDSLDVHAVMEFAANHGFPIIIEPRLGTCGGNSLNSDSEADAPELSDCCPRLSASGTNRPAISMCSPRRSEAGKRILLRITRPRSGMRLGYLHERKPRSTWNQRSMFA